MDIVLIVGVMIFIFLAAWAVSTKEVPTRAWIFMAVLVVFCMIYYVIKDLTGF